MRWLVVLLILFAGCAEVVTPGPSQWTWERSESMLPDFEGQGESFPVIVAHYHAEWSKRMQDDFDENPWVCADIAGNEIPIYGLPSEADAIACEPMVDKATGRLFVDPVEYAAWNATAIAVVGSGGCAGLVPLSGDVEGFIFSALEHDFEVRWHGDHFSIDGQNLSKGEVLKGTYWVNHGNQEDQRFVRVSFDFPGYWLESNVGPYPGYEPPVQPPSGSFVNGRLLEVEMPDRISRLSDALDPLLAAMDGIEPHVSDASIVVVDGRLTELVVGLTTETENVRWYMASRDDGVLRVLGNNTQTHGVGVPYAEALEGHDYRLVEEYPIEGANTIATRFLLTPGQGWASPLGDAGSVIPFPSDGCEDCVYLYRNPPLQTTDFYYAPEAQPVDVHWAATWLLTHHQADGSEVRGHFQGAIEES